MTFPRTSISLKYAVFGEGSLPCVFAFKTISFIPFLESVVDLRELQRKMILFFPVKGK